MKTALEILGGIFATLALAVMIFWFGWLSPPSPESVCDNVVAVTKAEAEKAGAKVSDDDATKVNEMCVARVSKEPEFGRGVWVKKLKCMRDAPDGGTLAKCDEIKSM